MKGEEPPKKSDGEGGSGQEEEDEHTIPMDDGGEVDNVDGEEELDDLTAEGELNPKRGRF